MGKNPVDGRGCVEMTRKTENGAASEEDHWAQDPGDGGSREDGPGRRELGGAVG